MRLRLYRGKWAVVWRDGGTTRRRSLHTADRELAERRFRDVKIERPGETVADSMAVYLAEKRLTARSFHSMETAWRALASTFGHLRPDQVTRDLCRSYASKRKRGGVSDGTIIKDLGVLKSALRWAKPNSGATFAMPAAPPPRERHLTREEFDRLLSGAALPHVRLFLLLALSTAGRASAVLDLTWDRVDFQRGAVRLSKGEKGRKGRATVPMTERLRKALLEAYAARESDFVVEWGGRQVKSVKRAFASAAKMAGVSDISPHVLRHSAAVWMAEAGRPMEEIAQFLGHTDPRVTFRVYARFSPDHLRKAAAALE